MRINNNIMAMNTHRQYGINNASISKSTEKLSSGYRINRAGDDAAGLAISEKMRAQIRGLTMASKNSQDAISLVQTAEGALQETHNILQRMRELAVQSASDTNEQTIDRGALQQEFMQLQEEINDIASKTRFNDQNLIDGTFQARSRFMAETTVAGYGSTISAISVNGAQADEYTIGVTVVAEVPADISAGVAPAITPEGVVPNAIFTDATLTGIQTAAHNGNTYTLELTEGSTLDNATIHLRDTNGDIVSTAQNVNMSDWEAGAADRTVNLNFKGVGSLAVVLTAGGKVDDVKQAEGFLNALSFTFGTDGEDPTVVEAKPAYAQVTINGETLELKKGDTVANFTNSGISIKFDKALSDDDITNFLGSFIGDAETISVGNKAGKALTIQSGANEGDALKINIDAMNTYTLGVAYSNISTQKDASKAITEVNGAVNKVSTQRAALGALQNRLNHKIANLDTSAENLQAAESRIRDVDMAKEMTTFTRNNILFQASTAMLAQANAAPQGVLQLLG